MLIKLQHPVFNLDLFQCAKEMRKNSRRFPSAKMLNFGIGAVFYVPARTVDFVQGKMSTQWTEVVIIIKRSRPVFKLARDHYSQYDKQCDMYTVEVNKVRKAGLLCFGQGWWMNYYKQCKIMILKCRVIRMTQELFKDQFEESIF